MGLDHKTFEVLETEKSLNFIFTSTYHHIDKVCEMVTSYFQNQKINFENQMFAINLVIREGLTNAVRHGNKNDPDKLVRFNVEVVDHKSLYLKIEDEGDGFQWENMQNSLLPEDQEHGRGIIIMEQYFPSIAYNKKGNILYLKKDL
ncbi:MAG: ATP-binding protein [Desulfobacteraceae bacterium]|nr:ATP-binding protein [Desulfobacteraceae bacterium]